MPKNKSKKTSNKPTSADKNKISLFNKFNMLLENKYFSTGLAAFYFIVFLIISFVFHKVGDYGVETDFFWTYVPSAKEFLSGIITIDQFRGPLYPIVLGMVGFITGNFFHAGILIGVASAAFVIYFSFEIIKKLSNQSIAFFTTLLIFFNPVFIQYSYSAGTDMFFNALAAGSLYFFYKKNEVSPLDLVLSAFMAGLAYLTRYNGAFLLGAVFIILFINFWNVNWINRLKASAIYLAGFFLTISPWGIYTLIEKGSFFYNENYRNLAYELYGKGKVQWDQFWFQQTDQFKSLTDVIFNDFGLFVSTMFNNVGGHFIKDMEILMKWHIGIFIILGLAFYLLNNPFKNWKTRLNSYVLQNLFFFALLLLVFYSERFSLFLIPFYAFFAVSSLLSTERISLKKFIPQTAIILIIAGGIILSAAYSYSYNSRKINSGPSEILSLKEWYFNNIQEKDIGKIITARKPHVAYYLDMKFYLFPMSETYGEFIDELKREKVDYLYFSTLEAAFRPGFRFLLDPKANPPGLETVVYFNYPPAVLYRVK